MGWNRDRHNYLKIRELLDRINEHIIQNELTSLSLEERLVGWEPEPNSPDYGVELGSYHLIKAALTRDSNWLPLLTYKRDKSDESDKYRIPQRVQALLCQFWREQAIAGHVQPGKSLKRLEVYMVNDVMKNIVQRLEENHRVEIVMGDGLDMSLLVETEEEGVINVSFRHNKFFGPNNRRPDILMDIKYANGRRHITDIEFDERAHTSYSTTDEQIRYNQILLPAKTTHKAETANTLRVNVGTLLVPDKAQVDTVGEAATHLIIGKSSMKLDQVTEKAFSEKDGVIFIDYDNEHKHVKATIERLHDGESPKSMIPGGADWMNTMFSSVTVLYTSAFRSKVCKLSKCMPVNKTYTKL
jgi:hypothetical protein